MKGGYHMNRLKKGQILDLLTILAGLLLTILYLLKGDYTTMSIFAGLTGYCVYTYRIKYKYIKLFSRKAL
jgi:hypothetical protein